MRLPLSLDHLAVAGETLEAASALASDALGVALVPGGKHKLMGTHNHLIGLEEGVYLEAIARDPAVPFPGRARWFDLDRFAGPPRLVNWICRTTDIAGVLKDTPGAGEPVTLTRGALRWTMAVPRDGVLPFDGLFPAIMEWWGSSDHPVETLPGSGATLELLELSHPRSDALVRALAPLIDDPRVKVRRADRPAMRALFATPFGERWLT